MNKFSTVALAALALAPACKVIDAPARLESLMVFGFVHTTDEEEIQIVADELPGKVQRNLEEIEKGFRVDSLRPKDLRTVGVDPGEVDEIVGALGRIEYDNDLIDVLDGVSNPHKDEIGENTIGFKVLDDTDRDCFLDQDCATYEVTAEQTSKQPVIGEMVQVYSQVFQWVEHEGEPAVVSRITAPDPIDISSGLVAIDQQYAFFMLRPLKNGRSERVEALWVEGRALGIDLPDHFLIDSAVNAMDKQAERIDDWIDGGKKPVE